MIDREMVTPVSDANRCQSAIAAQHESMIAAITRLRDILTLQQQVRFAAQRIEIDRAGIVERCRLGTIDQRPASVAADQRKSIHRAQRGISMPRRSSRRRISNLPQASGRLSLRKPCSPSKPRPRAA